MNQEQNGDVDAGTPVNTRFIKFSSAKQEVKELPYIDEEVTIIVQGTVVKREEHNNNDGTVDLVAVVRPFHITLGNEKQEN